MSSNYNPVKYPFVKKFSYNGFYYIYDVNSNQVIEVDKPVFDIICVYDEDNINRLESRFVGIYERPVIKRCIDEIKNVREQLGLFSNSRPKKVSLGIGTSQQIKDIHKMGIQQLVLEVTKDCNLNPRLIHSIPWLKGNGNGQ